jgi:small subunit ribosomal protein S19
VSQKTSDIPVEWKKFRYRGLSVETILEIPMDELVKLLPARERRSLLRGFTPHQVKLLQKIRRARRKGKNVVKTHIRDMIILPEMLGMTIAVYNGKEFIPVRITPEMIGKRLGDFSPTTKSVKHGEPGLKATRSSMFTGLK